MTISCQMPAAAVGATSMLLALATSVEAQQVPPDLPAAIICYAEADQSWRIGYLYRVSGDGTAVYMAPNGSLAATLDANGVLLKPKDRPAGLDCYGKTLDELRSSGRVME
jgi:hypothetical protein